MFFSTAESIAKMVPYTEMYESFNNLRGEVNFIVMSQTNVMNFASFYPMFKYYISVGKNGNTIIYTLISLDASSYNQRLQVELGTVYYQNQMQKKGISVIAEDGKFMVAIEVDVCDLNRELIKYILVLLENSAKPFRSALEDMGY